MTTTAPTPEEFLASTEPDEDLEGNGHEGFLVPAEQDPLSSVATAVWRLVDVLEGKASESDLLDLANKKRDAAQNALDVACVEIERLQALIDEVLAVCKPSVSKLANQVREVLQPAAVERGLGLQETSSNPPEHDAPVEEWRAYAESMLPPVSVSGNRPDVTTMNRAQIRTLLGIEQPVGGESA